MLLKTAKGLGKLKVKTDEKALEHIASCPTEMPGRLFVSRSL